jgi:hypothetical protein
MEIETMPVIVRSLPRHEEPNTDYLQGSVEKKLV